MLNEAELRKEGWVEGEWITLADGNRWCFPRPMIELGPEFGDDGSIELGKPRVTIDSTYDAKMEDYITSENGVDEVRALMRLAVDLLSRNYDLKPEHYREILKYRVGDESSKAMWAAIGDVAIGNSPPKPTASGSAS